MIRNTQSAIFQRLEPRFLLSNTWWVDVNAGGTQDGSFDYPFDSIQEAIDISIAGDEVIARPGTYNEKVDFGGKDLILRSTDPYDDLIVESTVIDAAGYLIEDEAAVTFAGSESQDCLLSGFTIKSGIHTNGCYGIEGNGALATIENNVITQSGFYHGGGGIHNCDGLIKDNDVVSNDGVGIEGCDGTIQYNNITHNMFGGILSSHGTIEFNTLYRTSGDNGSSGVWNCDGTIRNNYIAGNYWGGGLKYCDGDILNNVIVDNEAVFGGSGLSYCNGLIRGNIIDSIYSGGPALFNCGGIISNNIIKKGYGVELEYGVSGSMYNGEGYSPVVSNCIFVGGEDGPSNSLRIGS